MTYTKLMSNRQYIDILGHAISSLLNLDRDARAGVALGTDQTDRCYMHSIITERVAIGDRAYGIKTPPQRRRMIPSLL